MLRVVDNSGAELVECIKVLGKKPTNHANIGDKVVVVVQNAKSLNQHLTGASASNRVKRGDICRAVIVRTKSPTLRPDGSVIRFDDNACVLINQKDEPIGTRVNGVVARELRRKNFNKLDLPASRLTRQRENLNLIANYKDSAYKFPQVSKLHLIFKSHNAYGHMGAKQFWKWNLRTICFHNPDVNIEVTRVNCPTKEEQLKCPSVLKVVYADGREKKIDCKHKHSDDIMKELVELTQAVKCPEDEIPVLKQ
ncbi:hypothetical protein KL921_004314 [Ogataea angusta]|uniref:Large ribosomal subunit protein uL14m n=1 Tax=Pichia angusta TaxID=870730 RepID=A0AAN6DD60_PICAN|nr:uncharacterized protein KL928_004604 [Ogataea angusta]KAG7807556.1 hypothetical protein KL921_004314 [Ogataea angusta]KAG7816562.1 hypothetical protein KL928_004604 [Ogataea angusta]KAG7822981.1 hypothetical protein KL909_003584 [Ogataea angusta]KAG7828150.1 hypothetical protein KL920_003877 [Ogataea angusta]KAG7832986.1 hypothetical protein KL943_004434 [Ogataea angusta]